MRARFLTQYCTFFLSAKSWHIVTLHSLDSTTDIQYWFCITCTMYRWCKSNIVCLYSVHLKYWKSDLVWESSYFGQWDIKNCLTLTSNVRAVCWRKLISQNHLGAPINWGRKIIIQYFGKEWRERALIKIGFVCHKKDFKMDWEHFIYRDSC